jgi:signal recognition particle GTPase
MQAGINLSGNPTVILMSGLQGSGKTTFSGKLANFLKTKKNKKPLLVACDIYRPAAINQLHVVGDKLVLKFIQNQKIKIQLKLLKTQLLMQKQMVLML